MKYPDVASFVAASKAGETTAVLTLDNDNVSAYEHDADWVAVEKVFEAHPSDLMEGLLDFLGIPWEHA